VILPESELTKVQIDPECDSVISIVDCIIDQLSPYDWILINQGPFPERIHHAGIVNYTAWLVIKDAVTAFCSQSGQHWFNANTTSPHTMGIDIADKVFAIIRNRNKFKDTK
jgi:hypothetical protein